MHNPIDPIIPFIIGKLAICWIAYHFITYWFDNTDYSMFDSHQEPEDNDMDAFIACDATDDPAAFAWFQDQKKGN